MTSEIPRSVKRTAENKLDNVFDGYELQDGYRLTNGSGEVMYKLNYLTSAGKIRVFVNGNTLDVYEIFERGEPVTPYLETFSYDL